MRTRFMLRVLTVLAWGLCACAPPSAPSAAQAPSQVGQTVAPAAGPTPTLTLVVRYEVTDLAAKVATSGASPTTKRVFNASLALIDNSSAARPYLAESLPRLNSDSWKVLPDGGMETTYRLRPNLTWHDGKPLSADDFTFAYQVYTAPGIAAFMSKPQDQIASVEAPDPRTIVIRWRAPYPGAGALATGELDPLPRHLLDGALSAFLQDPTNPDLLMGNAFWSTSYVGLGPYKLDLWEPGSSIEGTAFDGHAGGRPKIDRIVVRFVPDENTAMTTLLAGAADIATDNSLRFEHAMEMDRQWGTTGGTALLPPGTRHMMLVQFRPDYLKTQGLTDVRVRRAMMHALDRQTLNEALFAGRGLMAESFVPPGLPYYDGVQRAITRYPLDINRTEQLMVEAGYRRDQNGMYVSAAGDRFRPTMQTDSGAQFDREMSILQDAWRQIGLEIQPVFLSPVQVRNNEVRNTFPDTYITSSSANEASLDIFAADQIGRPGNRWAGHNRSGWTTPEVERAWQAFNTTLDTTQRNQHAVDMMKGVSDEVPSLPLYFNISPIAFVARLHGPGLGSTETLSFWNIADWTIS